MLFTSKINPVLLLKQNGYIKNDTGNNFGFVRYVENGNRFHALIMKNNDIDLHFDTAKTKNGIKIHISTKWEGLKRLRKEINKIKNYQV